MGSLLLLYEPKSDAAAFSWGQWTAGLPLSNLASQRLRKVARSLNADPEATRFRVTLPASQSFRALVLGPMNVTTAYQYRIRSYSEGFAAVVYDSDWIKPFEGSGGGPLDREWEDPFFWMGIEPYDDPDRGIWLIHIFPEATEGRLWSVEIDDQYNTDGYIEIGRLFMPSAWAPSINYALGNNGLGFRNNALSSAALSGAKQFWRRLNPRQFRCVLDQLSDAEAYGSAYRFMQRVGFDGEVFVIPDPDDATNIQKRSFLGTVLEMDPLSQAVLGCAGAGFQIEEII